MTEVSLRHLRLRIDQKMKELFLRESNFVTFCTEKDLGPCDVFFYYFVIIYIGHLSFCRAPWNYNQHFFPFPLIWCVNFF